MTEYDASAFDDMLLTDPESIMEEGYDFEYGGPNLGYTSVVETFGYEIVLSERLGSWQGDIVFVLKNEDRVGFLVVGYGSCAGCDVLEAIRTMDGLKSFALGLHSNIKWFQSLTDLQQWLVRYVIEDGIEPGPYWYYDDEIKNWAMEFTEGLRKATE